MTTARFITGEWAHIFEGERSDRQTRILINAETHTLLEAKVQRNRSILDSFTPATRHEMADIQDSLVNSNSELFDNPVDYGLEYANDPPAWAV